MVRALIHDIDVDAAHFDDQTLGVYLALNGDNVRLAAADALDAWAALLSTPTHSHDIRLGDYWEDTSSAAVAMRALALQLRQVARAAANAPAFAIATPAASTPAVRDIVLNAAFRGEV
jgi:hypothetical protein